MPPCRHAATPPRCHRGLIALNVGGSAGLQRLPCILVGSVDEVADQGFAACLQGEVMRVPGALNRAAAVAGRATPKWLLRRVSGALVHGLR